MKRFLLLLLAALLLLGLAACQQTADDPTPTTAPTQGSVPTQGSEPSTEATQPTEQTGDPRQDWPASAQATGDVWPDSSIGAVLPQPEVEWVILVDGTEYAMVYIAHTDENEESLHAYQEALLQAGFDYQVEQTEDSFIGRNVQGSAVKIAHERITYVESYYLITFAASDPAMITEWEDLRFWSVPPLDGTVPEPPTDRWLYAYGENDGDYLYLKNLDQSYVYLKDLDRDSILQYIQALQEYGYDDVQVMEDDGESIVFKATGQFDTEADMYGTPMGVYRYYTVTVEFDPTENSKRDGYTAFVCFSKGL